MVSILIYRYISKSQSFELLKPIFLNFMTATAKNMAKESNYGTLLAIFIIFIKMQKFIRMLRKLIFKLLFYCLMHTVNFKLIGYVAII